MSRARSYSRTTRWNLVFHYLSIGFAMVSGIILVPVYLHYISSELYGAWLATGNIAIWITTIDPGLSTVLQQHVAAAYGSGDVGRVRTLVMSGLAITLGLAVIVVVAGLALNLKLEALLNLSPTVDTVAIHKAFILSIVASAVTIMSFAVTAANAGLQGSLGIGTLYLICNAAGLVATVLLLQAGYGILAIPLGNLLRGCGLIACNVAYLIWRIRSESFASAPPFSEVRSLLKLVSYTFSAQAASTIATNADAFLVNRYLGSQSVVVFSLTRRAPEFSRWIVERPSAAAMPALSHMVGSGNETLVRSTLANLMRRMIWILGLVACGFLALHADFVRLWVGSRFFAGQGINVIIVFGALAGVAHTSLSNLCMATGAIARTSNVRLAQAVVLLATSVLGAKFFGMSGLAAAPIIAVAFTSGWLLPGVLQATVRFSTDERRQLRNELGIAAVVAAPLAFAFAQIATHSWVAFLSAATALAAAYVLGLMLFSRTFAAELRSAYRHLRTSYRFVY